MTKGSARPGRASRRYSYKPLLEGLEDRTVPSAFWGTFAENPQHTGVGSVTTQPLNRIIWQTPVDLNLQYQGGDLLEHYGTPLLTQANTILVPVKTGPSGGFEVTAFNAATGAALWTESSDYVLPPHNWVPSYSPALTPTGRLYYPGAGGTVSYVDNVDGTPTTPTRLAYYGIGNYNGNPSAYNSAVFIDTPITSDGNGNIFFGVRVTGSNPLNLVSGIVRIDSGGNGSWVSATSAAGDAGIGAVPHNMAPALSNDGQTLYVGVVSAGTSYHGYLLGLDSTTLATRYQVFLWDPRYVGTKGAGLLSDGTSSPMVAPDGDVYYGVFGNPYNGSRGFLLHFDATLSTTKTPGGFGWDSTPVVVPASMDPLYTGSSTYLLFGKYNNYAGISDGGDGVNRVALLDPNATMVEPHASSNGLLVMNEVMSMAGPTPDAAYTNSGYPNAVREWCINTALVDPGSQSILFPSEDGKLYRFDLSSCSFSQVITVNPQGIGEAYVPTLEGPDGTVYTIENATLFAVGRPAGTLSVSVSSSVPDDLLYGSSVTFNAVVTSSSGPQPTGPVTFTDGTTTLATVNLDNTGHASFTTSSLAQGHHFITGTYGGDGHYQSASMTLVQPVLDPTTTTLGSSPNPANVGQAVTFTASVSHSGGSTTNTLDGMVTFMDASTVLGTSALNTSAQATFTTSSLSAGNHNITAVYGNDPNFADSTSSVLSQSVISTAGFVKTDAASMGDWAGAYGGDGYNVIGDVANYPSYAQVTVSGQSNYTWAASTADLRALQKASNPAGRIAATWYAGSSFTIGIKFTDGQAHQVALYVLDWDTTARAEQIAVSDTASGAALDTRSISGFHGGQYLVWNVRGDVHIQFTRTAGRNAVLSGLFFGGGGASGPPGAASFVRTDTAVQGDWEAAYGGDGYNVISDAASYPSYAQVSAGGQFTYTWTASTTDLGALQRAGGAPGRIAATWYSDSAFTIGINFTDGQTHQVALYLLDWDTNARAEQITISDAASGAALDSRSAFGFHGGEYLVWNLSGHVHIQLSRTGGYNAVVSGLFFGVASSPPAAASFVKADTAAQGNWQGAYGSDGYNVIGDASSLPAYAHVSASGQSTYTWAASTTQLRALQKAGNPADRIAATWYSYSSFTLDVNLSDGQAHQVALYLLDWDTTTRAEQISIIALSGTVLDTRSVSGFHNGEYLVWNLSGHVHIQFTRTAGRNAVVSGLFFEAAGN